MLVVVVVNVESQMQFTSWKVSVIVRSTYVHVINVRASVTHLFYGILKWHCLSESDRVLRTELYTYVGLQCHPEKFVVQYYKHRFDVLFRILIACLNSLYMYQTRVKSWILIRPRTFRKFFF